MSKPNPLAPAGARDRAGLPAAFAARVLAPFASHVAASRGRLHDEPESRLRSAFQRDRDRVIHCGAFRRLSHKTQVFVYHEGDYYRTRLTHTLEVAQIARSLCRALGLDEDLAEAISLAHDFGHTPFGHAGEEALDAAMADFGGFDHNAQTLRILTKLEHRYAEFDGLNLTWETLEGVVKHNGPLKAPLAAAIAEYVALDDLEIATFAGPEAQVAAIADDIAYNSHDIDDGLRAGLFELTELAHLPLVGPVLGEVNAAYPGLDRHRQVHEIVRRIIGAMVEDTLAETARRIARSDPPSAAALRALEAPVVAFSPSMQEAETAIKGFLFRAMYRHPRVVEMTEQARLVVGDLFARFMARPDLLPDDWRIDTQGKDTTGQARVIADYIAGMTDSYAQERHREPTRS